MHFRPKRSCACTTYLMSEGQLEVSLQNVASQAQSPTVTQGLSWQPASVLFQSGDHRSMFLCLGTAGGDLVWSVSAMQHPDQPNPTDVLQRHHSFKMKNAYICFP